MGSGPRARPALRQYCRPAYYGNQLCTHIVPLDGLDAAIDHSVMGFNRRKMEDQRRQAAEKEAAGRRATDTQVLEDAERLIDAWNERQAKRGYSCTLLVLVGTLPGLPHHECDRSAHARPPPRRGGDQSHSVAIVSVMPAERAICRPCAPVTDKHRRRNADRAYPAATRRVIDRPQRREAARRRQAGDDRAHAGRAPCS
jgi:hypothetical protein